MFQKTILIFLLILSQSGNSQKTLTETEKLAVTCKVWGFLKYYHPTVANGEQNWDQQLFDILPKVEKVKTTMEFSNILENWIDNLGEIKKIEPIMVSDTIKYFDKNFDLSWINNSEYFTIGLSKKLKFIENNRHQGKQFYYAQNNYSTGATNENYNDFNSNEKNQRLLALFRFWNVIEYFSPYKYLMDNKWDKTLTDLLPDFIEAQTLDDFHHNTLKLVTRLNDSHSKYYFFPKNPNYSGGRKFLPVNCKIIDNKLIVTQILSDEQAKLDDLKIGDLITKVNNKTIDEIIAEKRDFIPASNNAYYLKELVTNITSGFFDAIDIEMVRKNKIINKTITLTDHRISHLNEYKKNTQKIEHYKILKTNIGFVDMGKLKPDEVDLMMTKLNNTKAIIFDLRNYPKGTLYEISNYLNKNKKEFAKYTVIDLNYPGRFIWTESAVCGKENSSNYKGKVVVLLNEFSISQSEWTAMGLQTADNCTIIGSQTAGADGNVSHIDFIKDYDAPFSGIGVYYPDGRETQRIGIIPDIEIKPTILGIQQGKDEVLDRAIQFIKSGK